MDYGVWRFLRGAERLQISREALDDGMALIVRSGPTPRSYFFSDAARLEMFQSDMETLLLKTGWSFVAFAPDRRSGGDRRGWPRRANDRRRWWTDSVGDARSTSQAPSAGPMAPETGPATHPSDRQLQR